MNEDKAMKAYKALRDMESAADLKKNNFTLVEYREAWDVLRELTRNNGTGATTIMSGVATWFEKQGFKVNQHDIGFLIH